MIFRFSCSFRFYNPSTYTSFVITKIKTKAKFSIASVMTAQKHNYVQ